MNGWNILLAVENGIGEMQALVSGSNIEWGPLCTDGYTVGSPCADPLSNLSSPLDPLRFALILVRKIQRVLSIDPLDPLRSPLRHQSLIPLRS